MSEHADRFTVVLDTNVLVGALSRNMLLSLAEDGLFRARWSQNTLHQEFERTFIKLYGDGSVETSKWRFRKAWSSKIPV